MSARAPPEVRAGQLDRVLGFRPDLAAVVCGGNDFLTKIFDASERSQLGAARSWSSSATCPSLPSRDIYSKDMSHSSMRGHAVIAAVTIQRLARHLRPDLAGTTHEANYS